MNQHRSLNHGGQGAITQEWRYNGLRLELGGFAHNAKQGIGRMVTCTQLLLNSKLTTNYWIILI